MAYSSILCRFEGEDEREGGAEGEVGHVEVGRENCIFSCSVHETVVQPPCHLSEQTVCVCGCGCLCACVFACVGVGV